MFGKKQPEQPSQSQSLTNVTLTGGVIQQGLAGQDLIQIQSGNLETSQQMMSVEVIKHLENLEEAVKATAIGKEQKEELLDYLRPAKREAGKPDVNKELVSHNLKQVSETLKTMKDTTEAGKSLWKTGQEVFTAIAPWLGITAKLIGM